ncbi:single-stranded-DNA-specific exonuclease RecJ [Periweissella cryptocerci]|uniref:Single-stranded-DNA-specific exonuclease RecJ n=1 Tax=Periweissella cryptocerci TaxID=2506420 RepID=A0A4P6YS24_9LACO|nr:single-stranded-DNA-specific exonuclease RecJ [Periweissella cryptocerci]QBO35436.1 single-stranded-DNA-specific exonuclease RecJ [Periweissella cryptocerci]
MIEARYKWERPVVADEAAAQILTTELQLEPVIAKVLVNRGYDTLAKANEFLNPSPEQINDPWLLHDMDKAVARINEAIMNGERITVYGDYDTDGLTSTALMYETLEMVGADVNYYVPNRFNDGYGPNVEAYERLIGEGTQLIVTVDNGVAGHAAIARAKELGVDVVVTDHHELPETLPDAYAIVHPRHPEGTYPFGELSGVGVAFKVATALLEEIPQEMLDLVALGEIADLVDLVGENRTLVTYGLKMIEQTQRPGLLALMDVAGVQKDAVTATTVGFSLAPRLNALGRLGDAGTGVELLTTQDEEVATELAKKIDTLNIERQALVASIGDAAMAQAMQPENLERQTLVITGAGWHEGVLGIVASRVVEETGKPTLVLREEDGILKGSGRSVPAFNLFTALDAHRELFVAFGGHAAAAGMSVAVEQLSALQTAFEAEALQQDLADAEKPALKIATLMTPSDVTPTLYRQLQSLGPFGNGNTEPLFVFEPATLSNVKAIGAEGKHLKFALSGENQPNLNAIAFGRGSLANDLVANDQGVQVVGSIEENVWKGNTSFQLMVKDILQEGLTIVDGRTNKLQPQLFTEVAQYVFFNPKVKTQLLAYLPEGSHVVDVTAGDVLTDGQLTVLVDLPKQLDDLSVLQGHTFSRLTAIFYAAHQVYLEKNPSKEEFGKLYKYALTHTDLPIRAQTETIAKYLNIDKNRLYFMITVFFELGFVTIDDGNLNGVANPPHAELTTAPSYQARIQKQAVEKALIYSKTTELKTLLHQWIDQA